MPLAARQKATNASSVRPSGGELVEHAGRAGRGEHEQVLEPLLRAGRPQQPGGDAHAAASAPAVNDVRGPHRVVGVGEQLASPGESP